jgi:flavin-dependent dehydrogenase
VDPLTGEGIGQALETGNAAATAIIERGDRDPQQAAKQYRNYVRRGLAIDNSVAGAIAKLVRSEKAARAVIRMAPQLNKLDHYAIRWVFEDNPRAAALTPWRWKERFGDKRPAPYADLKENA